MQDYRFMTEIQVIWRDMDGLGHVNNAVYATYFETGRIEYLKALGIDSANPASLILAEITITFKSPAFLYERLCVGVKITEIRNSSFTVLSQIEEKESGRLVALSRAVVVHYDYTQKRPRSVPLEWREAIDRFEGRIAT